MIKQTFTVVFWHNGHAILQYSPYSNCFNCSTYLSYNSFIFNKTKSEIKYELEILTTKPLTIGQKVEIGISKNSLLHFMIFVYLIPLVIFFIFAITAQFLFSSQLMIILIGILGAIIGFFLAKR